MSGEIIDLQTWCETPAGAYLLAWEQTQCERAVADIFGYHALQLGLPALDTLAANRMPHRWLAVSEEAAGGAQQGQSAEPQPGPARPGADEVGHDSLTFVGTLAHPHPSSGRPVSLRMDYAALPFAEGSLDLVTLPHTLDSHPDPHAVLREVARVLAPGGRVLISGFNPVSLWGWRQRRERWWAGMVRGLGWRWLEARCTQALPADLAFINAWRLRDWLRLLNLEVEDARHGLWRPLLHSKSWLQRWRWLDHAGARWWPVFGAAYFIVAIKRVQGVRLLEPRWRRAGSTAQQTAPASLVRHQKGRRREEDASAEPALRVGAGSVPGVTSPSRH